MKKLITGSLLACTLALAGCAVPEMAADASDAREAAMAKDFEEEDGVMLTGSRIPQKSTSHSMRRIGSAEAKRTMGSGQHNPPTPMGGQ
ncbi:MAG: hypothetical protein ACXWVG_20085 [Telluria sp.]